MENRSAPADANKPPAKEGPRKKKTGDQKTLWVTIFRCFHCGKHGHKLPQCFKGNGLNHKAPMFSMLPGLLL